MRRFFFALLGLSLLGLAFFTPFQGVAQAAAAPTRIPAPSDDQVNLVARQLYCPVCENIPLDVCPTQACAQWRDLIRQKLAAGWTGDQIKQYFAAQYGDRVLAVPPRQGPNLWVNSMFYVLIGLSILAGILVLVRVLAGLHRPAPAGGPATPASTPGDAYLSRIEDDLRRLK